MQPRIVREYIAPGHRVAFEYVHHFNRHSRADRVKYGTVIRTVKHRKGTFYDQPMVVVHFDGNKSNTTVEMSRIRLIKNGEANADRKVATYREIPIKISDYTGEYHTYVNERVKPYIAIPLKTTDFNDMKRQIDEILDKDYRKSSNRGKA